MMSGALLVPLDGSLLSKAVLAYGVALARAQQSCLVLARVLEPFAAPGTSLVQEPAARNDLEAIAEPLRSEGLQVETVVGSTLRSTVARVILTIAHERLCSAIVMSTRGRT